MTDSGERLVGQVAKRQSIPQSEHTITAVKRLVGRKVDDEAVVRVKEMVAYEIVEADNNNDAWAELRDQKKSPSEWCDGARTCHERNRRGLFGGRC